MYNDSRSATIPQYSFLSKRCVFDLPQDYTIAQSCMYVVPNLFIRSKTTTTARRAIFCDNAVNNNAQLKCNHSNSQLTFPVH